MRPYRRENSRRPASGLARVEVDPRSKMSVRLRRATRWSTTPDWTWPASNCTSWNSPGRPGPAPLPRPADFPVDPQTRRHRRRADERPEPRAPRLAVRSFRAGAHRPSSGGSTADGTTKFLLRLDDGKHIETVCIPNPSPAPPIRRSRSRDVLPVDAGRLRDALCLLPHRKDGDRPNLTAGEIVGQVRVLVRELGLHDQRFNIVLMGMGEPLHNYDATMKALRMLADEHGMAVSPRRVTLSTVGVLPALERLATEPLMPNLAISLHSTTEAQRDRWCRSTVHGSKSCSTCAAGSRSSGASASRSST